MFKEGVAAAESRDLDGVMSKFSYNYRDDYGMTYIYLKETLRREFERISEPHIEFDNLQVKVLKDESPKEEGGTKRAIAEADVRVVATMGTETGYILGDPKEPVHLRFILEKGRMNWRVVKVKGFLPE